MGATERWIDYEGNDGDGGYPIWRIPAPLPYLLPQEPEEPEPESEAWRTRIIERPRLVDGYLVTKLERYEGDQFYVVVPRGNRPPLFPGHGWTYECKRDGTNPFVARLLRYNERRVG